MEGAIDNNVPGIIAECGGACACATCHAYVDQDWLNRLNAPEEMEQGMLEAAKEPKSNSRLICQIEMSDELDGITLTVADNNL